MSRRPKTEAAAAELLRDPHRSNEEIAQAAGCSRSTVRRVRAQLIDQRRIVRRGGYKVAAIRAALDAGWRKPDIELARLVGCSPRLVTYVRQQIAAEVRKQHRQERMG